MLIHHGSENLEHHRFGVVFLVRSSRSAGIAGKAIFFGECVTFARDPPLRFPSVLLSPRFGMRPLDIVVQRGRATCGVRSFRELVVRRQSRLSPCSRLDVGLAHKPV
jgi:hypothetical protein